MTRNAIQIIGIKIDSENWFIVQLEPSTGEAYEYIYRAAKGVYWDKTLHAFYMKTPVADNLSQTERFENILLATKNELGVCLYLNKELKWQNVELEVQMGIRSLFVEQDKLQYQDNEYINVSIEEDWVKVSVADYELFDFISDIFTERDLTDYKFHEIELDGKMIYEIFFPPIIPVTLIKSILSVLEIDTIHKIVSLNG